MPDVRALLLTIATIGIGLALLTGCTGADEAAEAEGGGGGMMGEGGGVGEMGTFVIADASNAAIEPGTSTSSKPGIAIARVVAPDDCWVVARSTTEPGGVLGATRVPKGESRDVLIELDRVDTGGARVALHVDRGAVGEFEFDPEQPSRSFDKVVVAGGAPVEQPASVGGFGEEAQSIAVQLMVNDRIGTEGTLLVDYVLAPGPSWISVSRVTEGLPAEQVGFVSVAGETWEVKVPLDPNAELTDELAVTLHADRGAQGTFEYDTEAPLDSADQPYRTGDTVVSERVKVR
jgi:hypothetical protein